MVMVGEAGGRPMPGMSGWKLSGNFCSTQLKLTQSAIHAVKSAYLQEGCVRRVPVRAVPVVRAHL